MEKIITFGEIMMRLSTPDYATINQTHDFVVNYGVDRRIIISPNVIIFSI